MAQGDYLAQPGAAAALAPASSASAWGTPSWTEVWSATTSAVYIVGVSVQTQYIPGLDTTIQALLEIGTGASGSESVKLQVPVLLRLDTLVGYYQYGASDFAFAEPYEIAQGTRVAVRVYDSVASAITYGGTKLRYIVGASAGAVKDIIGGGILPFVRA